VFAISLFCVTPMESVFYQYLSYNNVTPTESLQVIVDPVGITLLYKFIPFVTDSSGVAHVCTTAKGSSYI